MKYYLLSIMFFSVLISGCANEFLGAKKISYNRGIYVERWFLKPSYSKDDVPAGTAFYGDSANKIRNRFIIKYYIHDDENSEKLIPKSDLWRINHNGKGFFNQDDDGLFYYKKVSSNEYVKYKHKDSKWAFTIDDKMFVPIESCNDGWCKVYPNYYSNDLYIKQTILKEPLERSN